MIPRFVVFDFETMFTQQIRPLADLIGKEWLLNPNSARKKN
jgi:hypothetical protein